MPTAGTTNSFATIAEANTYFDTLYNRFSIWNPLSNDDKSRLLIEATEMLSLGLDWKVAIDTDDYSEATTIQKNACCEQAWALYNGDRQADPETKGIGLIEVETIRIEFDKSDRVGMFSASAINLLRDLITYVPGGLNVPVQRSR